MDGLSTITLALNSVYANSIPLLIFVIDDSYKENLLGQSHEGCNLAGFIRVNKVAGNFHVAPGRSFAINGMHVHDTVSPAPFLINIRRNISTKKMALENIIQAISSTISVSVPISMKPNSKVQKNGAIPSKTPKSTPMTVLPTHAVTNISKFQLPLLSQMCVHDV
jgi:hypothetical protein